MQMQHTFSVPVPIDRAWQAMIDPEAVAPCMPGATLTKAEGNEFAGSVKVKLGPVTLLYKGNGTFKETDESARRIVIDASGKDSRGAGTAAATVTVQLTADGDTTNGTVDTDLKVTGKPAQMGRGLISEVGGKILNQFSANLAEKLSGEQEAPAGGGSETAAESGSTGSTGSEGSVGNGAAGAAGAAAGAAAASSVKKEPSWKVTPADSSSAQSAGGSEAIDLLDTAGTPVLKRLAPVAAGLLVAVVVLRRIKRRKARKATR
ncbi:SRPBCC family protein [Saccharopolyspora griseoalba]|uniref:SRPBCC family protein n=1 Tax=Saccharopolyspora griseoalba TaxID=1431848 RepID=A0ABW2LFD0_9PSEU